VVNGPPVDRGRGDLAAGVCGCSRERRGGVTQGSGGGRRWEVASLRGGALLRGGMVAGGEEEEGFGRDGEEIEGDFSLSPRLPLAIAHL
jgi:hypothetical protein